MTYRYPFLTWHNIDFLVSFQEILPIILKLVIWVAQLYVNQFPSDVLTHYSVNWLDESKNLLSCSIIMQECFRGKFLNNRICIKHSHLAMLNGTPSQFSWMQQKCILHYTLTLNSKAVASFWSADDHNTITIPVHTWQPFCDPDGGTAPILRGKRLSRH